MPPLRIVITGAAGFVGSHLVERCLADGHAVVGVDSFLTGTPRNLAHLAGEPRFELVEQDVSLALVVAGRVDTVLHLASPASPVDYYEHPIATLDVGAAGTRNALALVHANPGARFLIASTSEVYGDPAVHPQPRATGGTSTRSARARATTRPSASPRRRRWPGTARRGSTRASRASSTRTGRACARTTDAWCRTSSCRRCAASR
jgi:nucleoside-diphosphate-sugar epimerase